MSAPASTGGTFDVGLVEGLDEPVRRYFQHALAPRAPLAPGMRVEMAWRVDVSLWMPFRDAGRETGAACAGAFTSGPLGLRVLRVVDQFADRRGRMDIRLRPGLKPASRNR